MTRNRDEIGHAKENYYATVTPLRKSESRNEPRKTIFTKLRGTWLSRCGYGVRLRPKWLLRGLRGYYGVYVPLCFAKNLLSWLLRDRFTGADPRGGGTSIMYAYWVCAARETPIFSPEFPFRSISIHKFPKNPFRSITILHLLADFAVPETIIFKISLISTRSSPPTAGSARTQRRGLARRVWQFRRVPFSR